MLMREHKFDEGYDEGPYQRSKYLPRPFHLELSRSHLQKLSARQAASW